MTSILSRVFSGCVVPRRSNVVEENLARDDRADMVMIKLLTSSRDSQNSNMKALLDSASVPESYVAV